AGVVYSCCVLSTFFDQQSAECPTVQVTGVPEMPLAMLGVPLAGGLAAFMVARRPLSLPPPTLQPHWSPDGLPSQIIL
ncbi:MAG: hypothetical protein ABR562_08520, partial [Thermoplasmatota archaeon]